MSTKRTKGLIVIIVIGILLKVFAPVVLAGSAELAEQEAATNQLQALLPQSLKMVNSAMAVISQGLVGMSEHEKEAFLNLYDPSATGEIDEEFMQVVLANYETIRDALDKGIKVSYEGDHPFCSGRQLYFTDLVSVHVCPYFFVEPDETRKARTLIHEYAHIALHVNDRPYYRPTSKAFAELTPRGPWTAQLPLIGPIVRELVARDTLYHPDTYAHFALAVSGHPGAMEKYLDPVPAMTVVQSDNAAPEDGSELDSWLRP